jgi:hypothetical protein
MQTLSGGAQVVVGADLGHLGWESTGPCCRSSKLCFSSVG